jgi:hypothetical protein
MRVWTLSCVEIALWKCSTQREGYPKTGSQVLKCSFWHFDYNKCIFYSFSPILHLLILPLGVYSVYFLLIFPVKPKDTIKKHTQNLCCYRQNKTRTSSSPQRKILFFQFQKRFCRCLLLKNILIINVSFNKK